MRRMRKMQETAAARLAYTTNTQGRSTRDRRTVPTFHTGFLVFPELTQLDMTGPFEVLYRLPGSETHLIWKTREPIRTGGGLMLVPTTTLADCPPLDLICIPGGGGVDALLDDAEVLDFVRRHAATARFVTSVCTGSLLLGAAGLLRGRRAACHWLSRDLLAAFGAVPDAARVVVDGNVITGGGITAGIDFALRVVAEIHGRELAEQIQLAIEYDPDPPFGAGSPATAGADLVRAVTDAAADRQRRRAERVAAAAKALSG